MSEQLTAAVAPVLETETSAPPEKVEPKQPDPNQKRWAHMAKQEKQIRAERARITAEREAMTKERAEIESYKTWKNRLSQGDFEALQEAGVTNEQLTNYLINQPNPLDRELSALRSKIAKMEEGQGNITKQMEEAQTAQYNHAVAQITNEVKILVNADPEKYELLNANESQDAAVELIKQVFDNEGYVMTVEEACNEVEEYLMDESMKITKLKKIQAKLAPPAAPPTKLPPAGSKPAFSTAVREAIDSNKQMRTLTHQNIPTP